MVVTEWPATSDITIAHDRTASPSRCTVQAPHNETPQPNLVPVRPSSSRKNHMSGIDGSPSNGRSWPFTRSLIIRSSLSCRLLSVRNPHRERILDRSLEFGQEQSRLRDVRIALAGGGGPADGRCPRRFFKHLQGVVCHLTALAARSIIKEDRRSAWSRASPRSSPRPPPTSALVGASRQSLGRLRYWSVMQPVINYW